MRDFEFVKTHLWRDREFLALEADPRLLFIWSFTDPKPPNVSGLFHAPPSALATALAPVNGRVPGNLMDRLERALHALAVKPFLLYDDRAEVVWVTERAKHTNRSAKCAARIRREFAACPDSPLKGRFKRRYGSKVGL